MTGSAADSRAPSPPHPSGFRHAPPRWTGRRPGSQSPANAGRGIDVRVGTGRGHLGRDAPGGIGRSKDRGTVTRTARRAGRAGRDDPGQEEESDPRPAPNRARAGFEIPRVRARGRRRRSRSTTRNSSPCVSPRSAVHRSATASCRRRATAQGPPRRIIRLYRTGVSRRSSGCTEPAPTRAGCHVVAATPSPVSASITRSTSAGSGHSPRATRRPLTTTP